MSGASRGLDTPLTKEYKTTRPPLDPGTLAGT